VAQSPLVTTEWLQAHLHDENLRIVDIRGHVLPANMPTPHYFNHLDDYKISHIPGAVFIDWVHEITDPADPRHAKIAPPERYAAVMNRIGIGPDTLVVAYDDAGSMFAARLFWSLNYYGHQKVTVLDGGWQKWVSEGRPVTAEIPQVTAGNFVATPQPKLIRTQEQVEAVLGSHTRHDGTVLIDVRTPEEFRGDYARAERKGHIPGAVNVPRSSLNAPDGTLKPVWDLQSIFREVLARRHEGDNVMYCNGGVSASLGFLAMRQSGLENVAVYDGSWKEWGNDPDTPIE
jgi:thiosulfate/3-mercaptopyruvate sulfurtransferase